MRRPLRQPEPDPVRADARPARAALRKAAAWPRAHLGALLAALLLILLLASSATLQGLLVAGIERPAELLADHPLLGGAAFVLLAALSAMLSLFSSVPLVPFAVLAWGEEVTAGALFTGWVLGGVASYLVGVTLHRRVAKSRIYDRVLFYRRQLRRHGAEFSVVLLFRVAIPAEIPGYVLGMLRYDFWKYLAATALAELPMALGAVYAGRLFVERRLLALAVLVVAAGIAMAVAHSAFHRRLRRT